MQVERERENKDFYFVIYKIRNGGGDGIRDPDEDATTYNSLG
jgi:hypothetical protein